MARRGPKPEPASVKLAKGNSGRRPIGADPADSADIIGTTGHVAPPTWLKKEGLSVWERLAPRLHSLKLLGPADAAVFGRYCRNFARWLKMQRILDKEGETYESDSLHGKLKRAHPAFLISDRIERGLLAVEDRFGLNPAERQRIFAQRAAAGATGDLFNQSQPRPSSPDQPRDTPSDESKAKSAIGLLN